MKIILKNICNASLAQQKSILTIRNKDDIRSMMYTEHVIELEEHLIWIDSLCHQSKRVKPKQIAFIVLVDEQVAGLISLNNIDDLHKKADLGFYLDKPFRIVSASIEFAVIDFFFNRLHLEKLNCEVLENNNNALKMHYNLGFLNEGFRAENIKKEEGRVGVHYVGLTSLRWETIREQIYSKYRIVFKKYLVSFK